ncbi:MAG: M20/M25/M40 family metallo-hydrolase [Sphingobacteriia bacterium]|nr:M20/M25/M40 family metallo-hydrolase [Sphingobacteriia bacterium]
MKKILLLALVLPFLASAQFTEDSIFIKKISDDVLTNGKAYDLLHSLTKKIGGRLAGSPQFAQAVQWGKTVMKELGADTVYLQETMVPHWVRGNGDKVMITEENGKTKNITLDALALGNSLGGNVTASVIAVKDFTELERRKDEVKGKIVFYNYPFNPTYIVPSRAYAESGVYRRNGPSRAAKYGAVGVLIRSLTEATDNNPHTGATAYNDSFPKIPCAALGLADAERLWVMCQSSTVKVAIHTHAQFLPDTIGHNVVAELKGTEQPDHYITVGGHLDSWDVNEGAHDDGAGVVHTIEVMRVLKALGYRPRHTIRFVLFANEENGLRGGEKYATMAKEKNEQHIFALESDEGGFTPRGFGVTAPIASLQKIQSWLPLLKPYGTETISAGGGGADIGPLARNLKTPLAGFIPDNQRYFDVHHARSDVFENVNKRELHLGAVNMAGLIYLVDKYGL